MLDPKKIYPIGIGTWGIGGYAEKDPNNNDIRQLETLVYQLQKGMNFTETCYWYAEGRGSELLAKAINVSKIKRDNLFLVASIYPHRNETLADAEKEFELLLKLFNTDYFNSTQFTLGGIQKWGINSVFEFFNKLLISKSTRYVSITNENLETLKLFYKEYGEKLFSHEIHYSFEVRENEKFGLIGFADKKRIKTIIFQPLRRNKTAARNWPMIVELSKKYNKTQNQIIINWLINKKFILLNKSENMEHIDENLKALEFKMEKDDYLKMDNFKLDNINIPIIDWNHSGVGEPIHNLPNVIDDIIDGRYNKT